MRWIAAYFLVPVILKIMVFALFMCTEGCTHNNTALVFSVGQYEEAQDDEEQAREGSP